MRHERFSQMLEDRDRLDARHDPRLRLLKRNVVDLDMITHKELIKEVLDNVGAAVWFVSNHAVEVLKVKATPVDMEFVGIDPIDIELGLHAFDQLDHMLDKRIGFLGHCSHDDSSRISRCGYAACWCGQFRRVLVLNER